jgi:site-specific recombinase XerD
VTGVVWIVELRQMTKGISKTVRRRTRDFNEAKRIEASLRSSDIDPPQIFPITIRTPSFNAGLPSTFVRTAAKSESSSSYEGGSGFDIFTVVPEPKIFTLKDLFEGARSIYQGTKDEVHSIPRLRNALETIGWDVDVRDLRTAALDYLVEVLHAKGLNPKTINRNLYAVSGALRWALKRELIAGMPAIPKQAEGVGRVNYLTEQDQRRVIQWLTDHDFEDVAFATDVLLLTGFRITEFLNLAQDNVRGEWLVLHEGTTKNDERRTVFVGEDVAVELSARIASGLPKYKRILEGLSMASSALCIKPKVTPHVLRHSCATMLATKGVSLVTVGKMLGHRSLSTTLKYSHTEDQALIDAAKALRVRGKRSG